MNRNGRGMLRNRAGKVLCEDLIGGGDEFGCKVNKRLSSVDRQSDYTYMYL